MGEDSVFVDGSNVGVGFSSSGSFSSVGAMLDSVVVCGEVFCSWVLGRAG